MSRSARSSLPRRRDLALSLYPLGLLALTMFLLVTPQAQGPVALLKVFAPWLFVPLLFLAPLSLMRKMALLRMSLVAAALTFVIVHPPAFGPPPSPPPEAQQVTILSWNLFVGAVPSATLRTTIMRYDPDLVLLQEANWEQVADDNVLLSAYPHHLIAPQVTAPGTLILSRYPLTESGVPVLPSPAWDMPRTTWAKVQIADRSVLIVNSHPIPPRTFEPGCSVFRCYNHGPRDAQIAELQSFLAAARQDHAGPLVLGGDLNVTEREPAFQFLAHGLIDAHRQAGWGFGGSWRPQTRVPWLPALIRIDYLLSADGAEPVAMTTDCSVAESDHCLIVGRFVLR